MDFTHRVIGKKRVDLDQIQKILNESLLEEDILCRKSSLMLHQTGLDQEEALMLLAAHKSSAKYGYNLSYENAAHLLRLAKNKHNKSPLMGLFKSPFLFTKTCWLYEHAPYFIFYNKGSKEEIDKFIIEFATQYDQLFLKQKIPTDTWKKVKNPKRVRTVTFWDNKIFDPVAIIEKVKNDNIEGLELSVDFHPFNYRKLLPEEITPEKRKEILKAIGKTGIKLDIHSPIVGPYSPSPDPASGKQLFFNPSDCYGLMCETIELAKDIGAGSVVIHLIDNSELEKIADLIMLADGTDIRVTIENYCQTERMQNSDFFLAAAEEILRILPHEIAQRNFGITLDVGHFNIEGEDPLIASEKIGHWCKANNIFLRLHATDNYGKLLFSPPAYSADVHGNVSGRGINNAAIIGMLRSMGLKFDVVAEQIKPLTKEDIDIIHNAQSADVREPYEEMVSRGIKLLEEKSKEALITDDVVGKKAYQYLVGAEGIPSLRDHLIYRKIQNKKYLPVDEVKRISQDITKMPLKYKINIMNFIDDLLLPVQGEDGAIRKNELDLICQNISGALFGNINNEHLDKIFSQTIICNKDEILCEQDTIGQEMYLIKKGKVDVSINGFHLAVLGPGEIFGEISLFYNVKRTATIKALKDNTTLGVLTREGFEALLKNSEPYSYDLIHRLYSILPERMRNLNDKYKTAIDAVRLILDISKKDQPVFSDLASKEWPEANLFPKLTSKEGIEIFKELKNYDKDQLIFTEGDRANGAYYILEGKVKAITFSSDGEEIELGYIDEGEVFGEMALIDDMPRSASIITVTPCKVAFVNTNDFNEIMESRSDLSFRLMGFICLSLFWRIIRLDKIYADMKKIFSLQPAP